MSRTTGTLTKSGMHPGVWWQGNDYSPQEKSQNIVLTIYIKLCSHISFSVGRGTTEKYQTYYANYFALQELSKSIKCCLQKILFI